MDVQEITGSYSTVPWDIPSLRVYSIGNTHQFAGNGQILPRNHIDELVRYVHDAYQTVQDQSGPKPLPDEKLPALNGKTPLEATGHSGRQGKGPPTDQELREHGGPEEGGGRALAGPR